MNKFILFILVTFFIAKVSIAQFPEQDCFGTISICQGHYEQLVSYEGYGEEFEIGEGSLLGEAASCGTHEQYSVWYSFSVSTAGTFEFILDNYPGTADTDYDFVVYDITDVGCDGIWEGTAVEVSCDYTGTADSTGIFGDGTLTAFEPALNVEVGHTYVIMIDHYSLTSIGYTIDFMGSTVLENSDSPAQLLGAITPITCSNTDTIRIIFSEPILCDSIALDGSDFIITGPSLVTVIGYSNINCEAGGSFATYIDLVIADPIAIGGLYTIEIVNGTDENSLMDACFNEIMVDDPATDDTLNILLPDALVANITFDSSKFCNGDSVYFQSNVVSSVAYSLVWNFGDGTTSTLDNPAHFYDISGSYTIVLSIQTLTGTCAFDLVDTLNIVIPFNAAFLYSPSTVCEDAPISFTNTSLGASIASSIWNFSDGGLDSTTNTVHTFASPGIYTAVLIITSTDACIDTTQQTIIVNEEVIANFGFSPSYICAGDEFTFTDLSTNSPVSWEWDFDDGATSSSQNPIHTYSSPGDYLVMLNVSSALCGSMFYTQLLTVEEYPYIDLVEDTTICDGQSVDINSNVVGYDILWSNGDTTQSITITANDELLSIIVDNIGCKSMDTLRVKSNCGLFLPSGFTPNDDNVNDGYMPIMINVFTFTMKIYNRWGEMIYQTNDKSLPWDGKYKNIDQPVGTYMVVVEAILPNGEYVFESGNVTIVR